MPMSGLQRIALVMCVGLALSLGIAGCVVYDAPPPAAYTSPDPFDRSWAAAMGAFGDEGVQIVQSDKSAGSIRGHLGDTTVAADLRRQADGGVRVEFGVSGNIAANPSLKDRVVGSYNRRMGR
jgi:hypothetical protein